MQEQDRWWSHTEGDNHLCGYKVNRRALQDLLESGIYLLFDEKGLCTNCPRLGANISMFYGTLSEEEISEALRLVGPLTKPNQPRDTSNDTVTEMDKSGRHSP